MTENEVLFQISNIVNGHLSFAQAADQIGRLLAKQASAKALLIEDPLKPFDAATLLDSFDQPYRSLYSVDLKDGGETFGKVTLCFAADRHLGEQARRLAEFVGEQLGMLLTRIRLAERGAELRREIAKIEEDLATRKVLQRAEGILIAKRGMVGQVAKRWIAQQSQRTGLSKHDVADRIIAYDQATGLQELRIA